MLGLESMTRADDLLARKLALVARKHRAPGAQLAIHHNGQTVSLVAGERESRTGRPVTPDTAFPIGSVTKAFTATVAMILVADGDVRLDAPLGESVPDLGELGDELTLAQVLSHTAGLIAGPDSEEVVDHSVRRYVDNCRRAGLILQPGTGFSYSNAGYVLVGRLIEEITGMAWADAMRSILLRPLAIDSSFLDAPGSRPVASGHSVNAGRVRTLLQALPDAEAPAGGLACSALDLLALGLLHVGDGRPDLLADAERRQMREPVPGAEPFGLADGWGLGWAVFNDGERDWIGHDGNADGTACYLRVDPVGGRAVALTTNANTGTAVWHDLQSELAHLGLRVPTTLPPLGPTTAPPADCAGLYTNGDLAYVVAVDRDGRASITPEGDSPTRLTFQDGLVFSIRDPVSGSTVVGGRFRRDPRTGRIDAIQMGGRLARRRWTSAREAARIRVA
jgi:CubicO group peptidase (beta-lactamase class C family)